MIFVENKRRKIEAIQNQHPNAIILDITSTSPYRYGIILSPFFPHGMIPIPGDSHGMTANSVESIWQGLKVFENYDVDTRLFEKRDMKGLKRTARKYGMPKGHRFGVFSDELLGYQDAKNKIYLPAFKYVLENIPEVQRIVERIRKEAEKTDIVLLDYNINPNNENPSKPLSHAELVKAFIEGHYPDAL